MTHDKGAISLGRTSGAESCPGACALARCTSLGLSFPCTLTGWTPSRTGPANLAASDSRFLKGKEADVTPSLSWSLGQRAPG